MPANISFADNKAEMFYYGDKPWHGLGTEVSHALTAQEAIEAAHLNWIVEKREIYFKEGDTFIEAKDFATVRDDTLKCFGIVGKNYRPIQNHEAFDFMDTLVATAEAKYHTAGALGHGETIWLLAKLEGMQTEVLPEDKIDQYLLLVNQHDGRGSLKVMFTPVRVVCQNTLNQATREAEVKVSVAHRGNIKAKIAEAQRILNISVNYFEKIGKVFKRFAQRELTQEEKILYFSELFGGTSKQAQRTREKLMILETKEPEPGTLWSAYNAVTAFVDHHRIDYEKQPERYMKAQFNSALEIKTKAYKKALQLIG